MSEKQRMAGWITNSTLIRMGAVQACLKLVPVLAEIRITKSPILRNPRF